MTENKSLITQIKEKARSAIEEAISNISSKTIVDVLAVVGFILGAIVLGIGLNTVSGALIVPGIALILLGIGRLMHNCGAFR